MWIDKGYVDFVCLMQYTGSAAMFDWQTHQTLNWADGKAPVYPGIGATLGLPPDGTLEQVLTSRDRGASGFVLFNYDRALPDHLALLRLGATNPK